MLNDLTTIYIILTEFIPSKNNTKRIYIKNKTTTRRKQYHNKQYKENTTTNSNNVE